MKTIVLRMRGDPLWDSSDAMSGCNASFVFVLSLLVHPLFLEASGRGNGGGGMVMICSGKIGRA